jgi:hypothetical protein
MTTEKEPEAEREAAEKVEERVEAGEKAAEAHAGKAHTAGHAGGPAAKKGLMERRESFSQSSVPNAHRGYNPKTPVVMMCIIAFMVVLSFVLAAVTF